MRGLQRYSDVKQDTAAQSKKISTAMPSYKKAYSLMLNSLKMHDLRTDIQGAPQVCRVFCFFVFHLFQLFLISG